MGQRFKCTPKNEAKQVQEETNVEYFYNLGDICPKATEKKKDQNICQHETSKFGNNHYMQSENAEISICNFHQNQRADFYV